MVNIVYLTSRVNLQVNLDDFGYGGEDEDQFDGYYDSDAEEAEDDRPKKKAKKKVFVKRTSFIRFQKHLKIKLKSLFLFNNLKLLFIGSSSTKEKGSFQLRSECSKEENQTRNHNATSNAKNH